MAPTLINSTVILNETLSLLRTECVSLDAVNRQYDKRFANSADLKPGTTLYVRKPIQVVIRTGKKLDVQDTVEEQIAVNCTTQIGVDLPAFTSEQITMNVDDFSERYLKPAASRIAAELDKLILQHGALEFNGFTGTAGTTPQTALVIGQCGQKLTDNNVPNDDRNLIINGDANTYLVDAVKGLYNPSQQISAQYKSGYMKSTYGLNIAVSNNIHRVTCGTRVGTILVDDVAGLVEGMSTVHVDGFTNATDTWKAGEKFTIADVYAVTPETKINTGSLMQFTVAEDFTAASNEGDLNFYPAIRATGARQNVNALPVDGKQLTPKGTASTAYPYNIFMHKNALALVTADLPIPKGTHEAKRDVLDGISMRFITDYDGKNDEFYSRFDIFYGITTLRRELGGVLFG